MNVFKTALLAIFVTPGLCEVAHAQNDSTFKNIPLQNLDAFNGTSKKWTVVSDASDDLSGAHELKATKGGGAILYQSKNDHASLATKQEFSDLQLELDFMTSKNTTAGIYMMNRYALNLADSWTKTKRSVSDAGSIVGHTTNDGTPPLMNVSRAPGLWQHLSLKFRAPKFNDKGEKTKNASFDEVYLNGVLVQQLTNATGPSAGVALQDEKPKGSLAFAGNDGSLVLKNIRYRELGAEQDSSGNPTSFRDISNPIILNPEGRPYILRSFVQYGDKKLTHVVSYGDPSEINFSYNLKQGALFQVWRGQFMNVTQMWEERGEPQLAVPLGSVVTLSNAPVVAALNSDNDAWPDSVSFDDQITYGYVLDKNRAPTFMYIIKGIEVNDSISKLPDGQGLMRTISVSHPSANIYVRLGESPVIENISGDLYALNGKSYFIRIDKKYKPVIRQSAKGKELIVKYDAANPVTYSIIW